MRSPHIPLDLLPLNFSGNQIRMIRLKAKDNTDPVRINAYKNSVSGCRETRDAIQSR